MADHYKGLVCECTANRFLGGLVVSEKAPVPPAAAARLIGVHQEQSRFDLHNQRDIINK